MGVKWRRVKGVENMDVSLSFYRKIESLEPQVREAFLPLAENLDSVQQTGKHMEGISASLDRLAQAQARTE